MAQPRAVLIPGHPGPELSRPPATWRSGALAPGTSGPRDVLAPHHL